MSWNLVKISWQWKVFSRSLLVKGDRRLPISKILLISSLFDQDNVDQHERKSLLKQDKSQPRYRKIFQIERRVFKRPKIQSNEENSGWLPSDHSSGSPSEPKSGRYSKEFQKSFPISNLTVKKRDSKLESKEESKNDDSVTEKPIDDVSESQERKRKKHKTTEYYYLLERKALRMMRRYYKEAFESYASKYKYKQNLKRIERNLAEKYFFEYIEIEFQRNKDTLNLIGKDEMVLALETIILCDRYNKNERVTSGLDFSQIRNLLNKYNSKNLQDFFKNTCHAFLFAHYFRLSSHSDVKDQKHVDQEKLAKQMEALFKKSQQALPAGILATVTRKEY